MKALWRLIGRWVFVHFARAQPCWFPHCSNLRGARISFTWEKWITKQSSPDCAHSFSLPQALRFAMSTPISSRYFWEKFTHTRHPSKYKVHEGVRRLAQQISKFDLAYLNSLKWYLESPGMFPSYGKGDAKKLFPQNAFIPRFRSIHRKTQPPCCSSPCLGP